MQYPNKSPDTVGAMKGLNTIHTMHSNVHTSKGKENFSLPNPPKPQPFESSLVFIAVDKLSFQIVQRLKGRCWLIERSPEQYSLDFCLGKEIWLLYTHRHLLLSATELGRRLQWKGAAKVVLVLLNTALAQEVIDG
jgi:hypothetical protein